MTEPEQELKTTQESYVVDETPCKVCPLWETSIDKNKTVRRSAIYGKGTGISGMMVYGEGLGNDEIIVGQPFVGDAGQLKDRMFREVGLMPENDYTTNVVRCRPPGNRTPKVSEQKACMGEHAAKDYPSTPPKLILVMGAVALKAVLGMQKITEKRGCFYDTEFNGNPVKVFVTFHPAAVLRKPELYDTVKVDLKKVRDYLDSLENKQPSTLQTQLPKITKEFINSKESFLKIMKYLADLDEIFITDDIETDGLTFFKNDIVSNAFTYKDPADGQLKSVGFLTRVKEGWWHADLQDPEIKTVLTAVLTKHMFGFQYGDFDCKFWWKNGYHVNYCLDTLDQHLLLDENSAQGLKFFVTRYLSEGAGYQHEIIDQTGGGGHLHEASPQMLLDYNMDDTGYTYKLAELFGQKLIEVGLSDFYYDHGFPLRKTLTRMSYRGILMDRDRILDLSNKYRAEVKQLTGDLFDSVNQKFKWSSTAQLVKVLYKDLGLAIVKRTTKGAPSTDKETLELLQGQHPAVGLVIHLRHKCKMLSTYLDGKVDDDSKPGRGMLQFLDDNNRVHCSFLTHGTTSGRLASRDPSLLNIPRDVEFRGCFLAPEGWKFIDNDYSQAELVLLGFLAQDPAFMKAVMSEDLHQKVLETILSRGGTAVARILKMSPKDQRNIAKAVNFRKAYRGGSAGLAGQLGMDPADTEAWYREWDEAFPMIPLYFQKQENEWRTTSVVEGIWGRKRHFPPAFKEETEAYYDRLAVNFPCQNGVADTTNRSLFLFDQALENIYGWNPDIVHKIPGAVLAVHDNVIVEAPDDDVEDIQKLLFEVMTIPLPKIGVSLKVDSKVTQRWGGD